MLPSQQPPVHDPDEVREAAREILTRAEFADPPQTLLVRILDWIGDLFGDAERVDTGAGSVGTGGSEVLTLLLVVAGVVVLWLVIRALRRQPARRRSDEDPEPLIEVTEHLTAAGWERAAVGHEAAGRWKDAVRCRFRALVEHLVERRVLDDIPGRTTGELRIEVAVRVPAASAAFDAAAATFDLAWYGDVEPGPDELQALVGHAAEVLAAAVPAAEPALAGAGG